MNDESRRREDQELARWQGQIESQVATVKSDVHELSGNVKVIDRTVTRIESRIESLQRELNENRTETRGLSATVDSARDEVVKEFKAASTVRDASRRAWRLTAFQVAIGGLVALVVAVIPTLVTLAITGQFH